MFRLEETTGEVTLHITLPEGKTQAELVAQTKEEIRKIKENFYGKAVKVTGRLTTGMGFCLGHELAHISKSVSVFDPKENAYIEVIKH